MREGLGTMEMVMETKLAFPAHFHFLKGNHENIANEEGEGNFPFRKFALEGAMVEDYLRRFYGEETLGTWARFEKQLPLLAVGSPFLASHAEPRDFYPRDRVVGYRDDPEVVAGLTWTDNDEAEPGSVAGMLEHYLGLEAAAARYFGGHRPIGGAYGLRADGQVRADPRSRGLPDRPPPSRRGDRPRAGRLHDRASAAGRGVAMDRTTNRKVGKYEVIGKVAQGGMGALYKARHPTLNRIVLLKRLDLRGVGGAVERFRREARLMMDFKNDHIVQVHDHFKEGSHYYIVEEYVDGISLDELIRRERYLSADAAVLILYEVAKALQYAHERGVIHRDIKPGNILISRQGDVKLADFGIATSREEPDAGPHPRRDDARHDRLHRARADRRCPQRRPSLRHLLPGGRPVRDADRPDPVSRHVHRRDHPPDPPGAVRAGPPGEPAGIPVPGKDRAAVHAAEAIPPLRRPLADRPDPRTAVQAS